jgi:nicotinamide-nucleotide amidase
MQNLISIAEVIARLLRERRETVAVAESSTGGLVSAALLAIPGASDYFLGGAIVYTIDARRTLLAIPDGAVRGMRAATEPYVLLGARTIRERLGASWGVAESGATGPSGNRYGDAPGHTAIAVSGHIERAATIETGSADRVANMDEFATAVLKMLQSALESSQ